jgi:serine/threonine protein kinase/tetratricopeptide (TPR) repeat protein
MNETERQEVMVFNAALDMSGAERSSYLDKACNGDTRLRGKVDALLNAHSAADSYFRSAAGVPAAQASRAAEGDAGTQPGDRIGRYKLLEKIGEGGCGVVYMAEQEEPVRRRVALKIIKPGMDSREVIARFEAERQALALMDHPNIARVFDGGTTGSSEGLTGKGDEAGGNTAEAGHASQIINHKSKILNPSPGRPFFVMELVRGIKITEYCQEHSLNTRQRLDLFKQICSAVQHAHQKGIIHRDLKPSNILVTELDGKPVPKVIDFGIAKATEQKLTDKTLFTQFAQFIGTPAYMSPEQAALSGTDIDTRSDIYSLGVLLYELLTGTTPFDAQELLKAGFDEMRRIIRETEPPKPSTRLTQSARAAPHSSLVTRHLSLSTDLDWIVMKCLEKDRTRRYETASGLAADILHHINSEPIAARPPSAAYRFRKMVRRNRVAFSAVCAVVVALVTGLTAALILYREARASRDDAARARMAAIQDRDRAQAAERKALEERDIAKAVNEFLDLDLLSMASSQYQADEGLKANPDLKVIELLDRAAQRVRDRFNGKPAVEAAIRYTIGGSYLQLGDPVRGLPHLERAVELRLACLGERHLDTIDTLWLAGTAHSDSERFEAALPLLRQALKLSISVRPPDDPATLKIRGSIGDALAAAGKLGEAIPVLEDTLRRNRANAGQPVQSTAARRVELGNCLVNLGLAYARAGRRQEARANYEEGLAILRSSTVADHPSILAGMQSLAAEDAADGNVAEAAKQFEELVRLSKARRGPEHPNTLEAVRSLAWCYGKLNRDDEASALHRESLELTRKLESRNPERTFRSLVNLGNFYHERNRFAQSEPCYREALEMARKTSGVKADELEDMLRDLADAAFRQGKYAQAEPVYRELLLSQNARLPATHDNVIGTTASLARLLAERAWAERTQGPADRPLNPETALRAAEAERLLRECLRIRAADKGISRLRLGDTKSRLGAALLSVVAVTASMSEGQRDVMLNEAESLLLDGHRLMQDSKSSGSKYRRDSFDRLVRFYSFGLNNDRAAEWQRELERFDQAETAKLVSGPPEAPP